MARASPPRPAPDGGLTAVQRAVINAHVDSMTGFAVDVATIEPLGPAEFAESICATATWRSAAAWSR